MSTETTNRLSFEGNGGKLFSIQIVNFLLTLVTFGFYYPWARAATLKYIHQESEFLGSRFSFLGTGKELFKGFIVAILYVGVLYGAFIGCVLSKDKTLLIVGTIILYAGIFIPLPYAIHSGLKYRLSRTTWRGIHFGYRGELGTLYQKFFTGLGLTLITIGIYGSWYTNEMRKYQIGNFRLGNVSFKYTGEGMKVFIINLKGLLLTIVTFGIYIFWYSKESYNYYIENIVLVQDEKEYPMKSYITGGGLFQLFLINILITIFTLGLGTPWATARSLKYILTNLAVIGDFNPDIITQTEENYKNAAGEDYTNMTDVGLV